jgi:hypothetical protein
VIADCATLKKCAISIAAQDNEEKFVDFEQIRDLDVRAMFAEAIDLFK